MKMTKAESLVAMTNYISIMTTFQEPYLSRSALNDIRFSSGVLFKTPYCKTQIFDSGIKLKDHDLVPNTSVY